MRFAQPGHTGLPLTVPPCLASHSLATLARMSGPTYVFAGGGTGGHLYPGIAVADALRDLQPTARIVFFTTTRPLDRRLLAPRGYEQVEQDVAPFTLHPLRVPHFLLAWRRSVARARAFIQANNVQAVLGLGGYAAGPPVAAAQKLGVRNGLLNPDAIPGKANRHLARRADLVVLQWDVSRRYLPAGAKCSVLGCPIRPGFGVPSAEEGRRHFGLDAQRPVLLVTGASQGARTINEAVATVWPAFQSAHPEWQLLHLAGTEQAASVRAAYATARNATVVDFTSDMHLAMAAADIVVSRAGASTLAELTVAGKPSILFPYPYHRDQHQRANAQELVREGAAVLITDQQTVGANGPALRSALEKLSQTYVMKTFTDAARQMARPSAALETARWLAAPMA